VAAAFDMLLIGRVESLIADLGPADAFRRANAYADAGADLILIHSKKFAPLRDIAQSGKVKKPLIAVPTLFGETSFQEMAACGIAGAIYANQMLRAMVHACGRIATTMLSSGSLAELDSGISPLSTINKLVKVPCGWSEAGAPVPVTNGSSAPAQNGRVPSVNQRSPKSRKQAVARR
jgi:2-methylisocitrate lyase-like PEP mutase family enzyme